MDRDVRAMRKCHIQPSLDLFARFREADGYYVDKTQTLREMLLFWERCVLICRPRRFGKTVWLSMCQEFLDISRRGTHLFDGLKIMDDPEMVSAHMNRYPVLFLTLKDVYGDSLKEVQTSLRAELSCAASVYKKEVMELSGWEYLKQRYLDILYEKQPDERLAISLLDFSECLYQLYGQKVIVLVDEVDVPMAKAAGTSYDQNVKNLIEKMLSSVCKSTHIISRVILTGCLDLRKASSHAGLEHLFVLASNMDTGCDGIGFTEEEVKGILADIGRPELMEEVRSWYDGYTFGPAHMYNPWDVLCYVNRILDAPKGKTPKPESYWIQTAMAPDEWIFRLLDWQPGNIQLLGRMVHEDDSLLVPLSDTLTAENVLHSEKHVWTALLETEYLPYDRENPKKLRIPNREVKQCIALATTPTRSLKAFRRRGQGR